MALKKLSITEQEAEQVRELLEQGLSHYKIAEILHINRPKIWRNAQFMGIERKKEKEDPCTKFFRWSDYNNSVI